MQHELQTTEGARACRRCAALLRLDAGEKVGVVANEFGVTSQTLRNWRRRWDSAHRNGLRDLPRAGRPLGWTDERLAMLERMLFQSPRKHGFRAVGWTVGLLQTRLQQLCDWKVSRSSLRDKLSELDYVWKRFRYTLKPDPEREKKKAHL